MASPVQLTPRQRRRLARFRKKDRARWLCDFLNMGVPSLRDRALRTLGWEVGSFACDSADRLYLPPDYHRKEMVKIGSKPPLYHPARLRGLHARLRAAIDQVWSTGSCLEPFRGMLGVHRRPNGCLQVVSWGGPEGQFLAQAWEAIAAQGARFRLCQRDGCRSYFVARDRRQVY